MTIGTEPQIDVAPAAHRLHRKGFEHRSGTQNVRERVSSLIALAVRGLAELYQPEDQYFPHTMRGSGQTLENHPASQRRTGPGRAAVPRRGTEHAVGGGPDLYQDPAGDLVFGCGAGCVLLQGGGLADGGSDDHRPGPTGLRDGAVAP
jgi:hypothetical protein